MSTFIEMTQSKILRFLIFLAAVTLFLSAIKAMPVLQKLTVSLVQGAECGHRSKWKNCEDTTLGAMASRAALPEQRALLPTVHQAVGELLWLVKFFHD